LCHKGVFGEREGAGVACEGIAKSKEGGRGNLIQKCNKNPTNTKVPANPASAPEALSANPYQCLPSNIESRLHGVHGMDGQQSGKFSSVGLPMASGTIWDSYTLSPPSRILAAVW
jgi:hypothetical protein